MVIIQSCIASLEYITLNVFGMVRVFNQQTNLTKKFLDIIFLNFYQYYPFQKEIKTLERCLTFHSRDYSEGDTSNSDDAFTLEWGIFIFRQVRHKRFQNSGLSR